jgi:hypothetical protein
VMLVGAANLDVVAAVTDIASVRDGVVTAGRQIASTRNAAMPTAMATKSFFMHLIMPPTRNFRREANQKLPDKHFLPSPVFLKSFWHRRKQFTMQILPMQQIKTSCQKLPCQEGPHVLRYYGRPIQSDMRRAHCLRCRHRSSAAWPPRRHAGDRVHDRDDAAFRHRGKSCAGSRRR